MEEELAGLEGQRDTVFKGEILRAILLNAYGWWRLVRSPSSQESAWWLRAWSSHSWLHLDSGTLGKPVRTPEPSNEHHRNEAP